MSLLDMVKQARTIAGMQATIAELSARMTAVENPEPAPGKAQKKATAS
jgi:hypothetical protein